MTDLNALAATVEGLSGPCRETDAEVARTLNLPATYRGDFLGWDDVGHAIYRPGPLHYTASLDAALTLAPPECYWQVGHDGEGRDPSMFSARVFDPLQMKRPCTAVAETAALALTAAALRARAKERADG